MIKIIQSQEVLDMIDSSSMFPNRYTMAPTELVQCSDCMEVSLEVFAKDAQYTKFICEECEEFND